MENEKLFELCRLLLPEDPTLENEVRNSLLNPEKAIAAIQSELGHRVKGLDLSTSLPWYRMIAGLYRRDLMFELSARTVAEGMDFYTNQLLRELSGTECAKAPMDTSGTNDAVELIHTFLEITGEHLRAANYLLGEFRLKSGISMITLIPLHAAKRCLTLAKEAGHGDEIKLHPSTTTRKQLPRFLLLTEMVDQQRRKENATFLQSASSSL